MLLCRLSHFLECAGHTIIGPYHALHAGNGQATLDSGLAVLCHQPHVPRVRWCSLLAALRVISSPETGHSARSCGVQL